MRLDPRAIGADLLDVVAPRECVGCGEPGRTLCPACRLLLRTPPQPVWRAGMAVVASGWLEGVLGAVVRGYKSGAGRGLVDPLARRLQAALAHPMLDAADASGRPRLVVPVPPSLRARWTRGEDIWGRVVQRTVANPPRQGRPLTSVPALELVRVVRDQRHLGARDRGSNVVGSMAVRDRSMPAHPEEFDWIVVDDVLTTGATLREAVRALTEFVPADRVVGAAVVAATRSLT